MQFKGKARCSSLGFAQSGTFVSGKLMFFFQRAWIVISLRMMRRGVSASGRTRKINQGGVVRARLEP